MNTSSLRRIDNMRRLVAALANGAMGAAAVARLLDVSDRAARHYLDELAAAGAGTYEPGRRSTLRLHPDPAVVDSYLAALAERVHRPQVALRHSPSRHCADPGKRFLHVLADDMRFPLELNRRPAGRDPLVAALFGPASHVNRAS